MKRNKISVVTLIMIFFTALIFADQIVKPGQIPQPQFSTEALDNLIKVIDTVKNHKLQWLEFAQNNANLRYKLKMDDFKAMIERKKELLKKSNNPQMQPFFEQAATAIVQTHKANLKRWAQQMAPIQKQSHNLYQEQLHELDAFSSAAPAKNVSNPDLDAQLSELLKQTEESL